MKFQPRIALSLTLTACCAFAETKITEISQYGITWSFTQPVHAGQYASGDWWVVGPATVKSVSPEPTEELNGSVVNPPAGIKQGYDARLFDYDAGLRASFPLELKPGESLVSTIGLEKTGMIPPDSISRSAHKETALHTAAVLTCVAEAPPADAFRPAYVGNWKETFRASQLRRGALPGLIAPGTQPDLPALQRTFECIWLDHKTDFSSNYMHPMANMPEYGRDMTYAVSDAALAMMLKDPDETLLVRYIQKGIDYYGTALSDNNIWIANGGHNSGRKWPILFAGIMLDHQGMKNVQATFQEDQQTYHGNGFSGQTALWSIRPDAANAKHEEMDPAAWEASGKGINNGTRAEAYRKLNGPTWIGQALAARMIGAMNLWNHPAYFDYVDRWVKEEGEAGFAKRKFIMEMWDQYRSQADAIGEESAKKQASK